MGHEEFIGSWRSKFGNSQEPKETWRDLDRVQTNLCLSTVMTLMNGLHQDLLSCPHCLKIKILRKYLMGLVSILALSSKVRRVWLLYWMGHLELFSSKATKEMNSLSREEHVSYLSLL